jgi:hypothetical protein
VSGETYTPFQDLPDVPSALGTDNVRLEPRGSRRLPTRTVLDLRLEKTFGLGRGRLGLYADVTNAFNASTAVSAQRRVPDATIPGFAEPVAFGAPAAILPPRQMALGARYSF